MEKQFTKTSGLSLFTGALLMVLTMVLHPSGGSIEHILKIKKIIVTSHSLAILSIPFMAFGFYGLSVCLKTPSRVCFLAFSTAIAGLIAAMIAGTINGLTLPYFLSEATENNIDVDTIKAIIRYGKFINLPMGYIFIGCISAAIAIWSLLIVKTKTFPKWLGSFGLLLVLFGMVGVLIGFDFVGLFGFRIFVFGVASWILAVAMFLIRLRAKVV